MNKAKAKIIKSSKTSSRTGNFIFSFYITQIYNKSLNKEKNYQTIKEQLKMG